MVRMEYSIKNLNLNHNATSRSQNPQSTEILHSTVYRSEGQNVGKLINDLINMSANQSIRFRSQHKKTQKPSMLMIKITRTALTCSSLKINECLKSGEAKNQKEELQFQKK